MRSKKQLLKAKSLKSKLKVRAHQGEAGASLLEYGLLVALILVVSIGAIGFVGEESEEKFLEVAASYGGGTEMTRDAIGDDDCPRGICSSGFTSHGGTGGNPQ